jgi:hypothetical protein
MSRIIEHKDLIIWRDARGKWQCRSTAAPAASGMVYRSGDKSTGTEAIRRKFWRGAGKRQSTGISEREIQRLIVKGHRNRLNAPVPLPANESKVEQELYIRRLRERHGLVKLDPRIAAADVRFRMSRW